MTQPFGDAVYPTRLLRHVCSGRTPHGMRIAQPFLYFFTKVTDQQQHTRLMAPSTSQPVEPAS
eukprot:2219470-Prymnesium_polylepis.3